MCLILSVYEAVIQWPSMFQSAGRFLSVILCFLLTCRLSLQKVSMLSVRGRTNFFNNIIKPLNMFMYHKSNFN